MARRVSLSAVLLFAGLLPPLSALAQENVMIDEIVAVVEDEIVLRSDVNALVLNVVQQGQADYTQQLWRDALNEIVDQKVILAYARRDTNVTVTDEQLNQELDQRIQTLTSQAGGEQRLEEFYGKSVLQIRDDLRDRIRDQLLAQEYQRQQLADIKITPSEVRQWFAQFPQDSLPEIPQTVRVSHIVRFPEIDPIARQEALQVITSLRDSLLAGASFEPLATQFSDDPGSASSGGRYESFRLSDLVPEFGAVASTLEPGDLSQVFETTFGYHVMRLNSRVGDIVDFNHILIRINDSRILPEKAINYLNAVRDSVVTHNIAFGQLAKRHSEDPLSAARGGQVIDPRTGERDLPTEGLGPRWVRTLSPLQVGDLSQPAETELLDGRTAYHIVRLDRRTPAHTMNIETDYARIEQFSLQNKQAEQRAKWLERLRKGVFVSVRIDEVPDLVDSSPSR